MNQVVHCRYIQVYESSTYWIDGICFYNSRLVNLRSNILDFESKNRNGKTVTIH